MFLYRPTRSVTGRRFSKMGRRYVLLLMFVLMGYALFGRGFAYYGIAPLFIGEMTLGFGILALFSSGQTGRVLQHTYFLPLICFMLWGLINTIPYVKIYGVDSIRDAVVWGYGMYALVTAGVLLAAPERLAMIVRGYQRFAVIFLFAAPLIWLGTWGFHGYWPINPLTGIPFLEMKGGDACVHLAGIMLFLTTLAVGVSPWIAPLLIPLALALNLEGRAGIVSFCMGAFLSMVLKPFNAKVWRILAVIFIAVYLLWATDLRIKNVGGGREISFNFLLETVQSIYSSEHADPLLEGSKEWRLRWWNKIINYTFHGKYFWTGKGFGINLADDDGFQTDGFLRSPHNGHLMILARSGVPGIALWALTQFTFAGLMLKGHLAARRRQDPKWAGLFICLLGYWAALLTNASFDVFIEGPMGGIWLWSIYGVGIASLITFKRYPQVLYLPVAATDV
jgi:hypothetical protein